MHSLCKSYTNDEAFLARNKQFCNDLARKTVVLGRLDHVSLARRKLARLAYFCNKVFIGIVCFKATVIRRARQISIGEISYKNFLAHYREQWSILVILKYATKLFDGPEAYLPIVLGINNK